MSKTIIPVQSPYGWGVKFEGGGQLPDELKGLYTAKHYADTAIANYLATRRVRKPSNAKSRAESRT